MFANIYQKEARYHLKLQKMKLRESIFGYKEIKKELGKLFNT